MPPLTVPITVSQAKELTQRIKRSAEATWKLLAEAHERKAWKPLGYKSWKAYAEAEFGMSESNAHRLLNQAHVAKALTAASGDARTPARGSPTARQAERIKPKLDEATTEVRERVEAGETPERVVPEVVQKYGGPPPRSDEQEDPPPSSSADEAGIDEQVALTAMGSGPHDEAQAEVRGSAVGTATSDIAPGPSTDPTQGEGDEGAAAEGDVDPATAVGDDGSQSHDLGRSAPEPTPAWQGPGGRAGAASVGAPAGPGPSFDVAGMVHALRRVPDPDAEVVATNELRVLVAWCQRQLAHRGFEDPHERCREHLAHMQRLLDEARAAA
jgi:hypothetical protein